jgi:hypothetical protein
MSDCLCVQTEGTRALRRQKPGRIKGKAGGRERRKKRLRIGKRGKWEVGFKGEVLEMDSGVGYTIK